MSGDRGSVSCVLVCDLGLTPDGSLFFSFPLDYPGLCIVDIKLTKSIKNIYTMRNLHIKRDVYGERLCMVCHNLLSCGIYVLNIHVHVYMYSVQGLVSLVLALSFVNPLAF